MQQLLECRGFELTCRGSVNVKGKGSMITYFLKGKGQLPPTVVAAVEQEPPKSLQLATAQPEIATEIVATPATVDHDPNVEDDDDEDDIDLNCRNETKRKRITL